jgi:hypothetical protein
MNTILAIFFVGVCIAVPVWIGVKLVQEARKDRLGYPAVEAEEFINVALCETKHGIKTHYHVVGFAPLNYGGYPPEGHPTLCGASVGWDMEYQDNEADCLSCRESLAKMALTEEVVQPAVEEPSKPSRHIVPRKRTLGFDGTRTKE